MGRNTDEFVDDLSALIATGQDHSLEAVQVSFHQAESDLAVLIELIHSHCLEDQSRLEEMCLGYSRARKPGKTKKFDLAYRIRSLLMDR